MNRLGAMATCLALLMTTHPCRANLAAPWQDPGVVGAPATPQMSPLKVEAASLLLTCRQAGITPVCTFVAKYTFFNPSQEQIVTTAAFYGVHTSDVTIRARDEESALALSADQKDQLDRSVRAVMQEESLGIRSLHSFLEGEAMDRDGFSLSVNPGERMDVVVNGTIEPGELQQPSYATQALVTRHILLGTEEGSRQFHFSYLVAPIRTWGAPPPMQVTLRYPATWSGHLTTLPTGPGKGLPQARREDDQLVERVVIDSRTTDSLQLGMELPSPAVLNGGVLLAAGGNLDDSGGFRARLGYAIASPRWLAYSINLDTDFEEEVVICPLAEAISDGVFLVFPSAGLGLGVPVRVRPRTDVGIRIQLTLHWPLFGFVTSFDIYPGMDTDHPGMFQVGMFGQVAF
jgi:hypothetical protein